MKKILTILLLALLAVSMTACGGKPSDDEIKAALEDGTITVEDAQSKGWIDEAWVEANVEQMDAMTKIYRLDPFETTYLDGTPASSELIEGKMCLVFINALEEGTVDKLDAFKQAREEMEASGIQTLGILSGDIDTDAAKEALKDMGFPIILRNDDMQRSLALSGIDTMLDPDVVSVFTKDGGIYTAWNSSATAEGLIDYAKELANEE